jgi:hypothetical protein
MLYNVIALKKGVEMKFLVFFSVFLTYNVSAASFNDNYIKCVNSRCFYQNAPQGLNISSKDLENIPPNLKVKDLIPGACFVKVGAINEYLKLLKIEKNLYTFLSENSTSKYILKVKKERLRTARQKIKFLRQIKSISCRHTPHLSNEIYINGCIDNKLKKSRYYCKEELAI